MVCDKCSDSDMEVTASDQNRENKLIKWARGLSDEELEEQYYKAAYDCLGSEAEEMYERGWDIADIRAQEEYERD